MDTTELEPIFARQEQAVVYFFSRYWQHVEPFCHWRLDDIQMRFPDASMEDPTTGDWGAIEFEYALGNVYSHFWPGKNFKATTNALRDGEYKSLYVVYWEEDTDKKELREHIKERCKKQCPKLKKVEFLDLRKYFSPRIQPESDYLGTYWKFTQDKSCAEAYSFQKIQEETLKLVDDRVIRLLEVNDGQHHTERMYRIAGFAMPNANFIETDHWKGIHYYTTGFFADESIPARLFLKPTGSFRYSGCFEVKLAFRIIQPKNSRLADYYRKFYFYPYDSAQYMVDKTCLVYSGFTELDVDQGARLYNYLDDKDYAQRMAAELIRDRSHLTAIDKIVG